MDGCEILDRSKVLDNQRLRLGPKRVGIFTIESFSFCSDKRENDSTVFFELVDFGFAMVWRSVWWPAGWLATVWRCIRSCVLSCIVAAPLTFLMIWALARLLAVCGDVFCFV